MVDINNALWSTTDASNNAASPNGYNSSTTPANVVAIEQGTRGAVKRLWERSGPAITAGGTANALTYTPSNTTYPSAYVKGDIYTVIPSSANSGAATFQVIANSLPAVAIRKNSSSGQIALSGGEIQSGFPVELMYDGTFFNLINDLPAGATGYASLSGASFTGAVNFAQSTNLASASMTAIGAASGNYINITGTTTITSFDTVQAGAERILNFNSSLTLTYNATSLILPDAANIQTTAGDIARFISLGSGNWICVGYFSGIPFAAQTSPFRAIGSIYQNTTGKTMFITIAVTTNVNQIMSVLSDGSSNPTTNVGNIYAPSNYATFSFMVLNGNYYKLTGQNTLAMSIGAWTEWF